MSVKIILAWACFAATVLTTTAVIAQAEKIEQPPSMRPTGGAVTELTSEECVQLGGTVQAERRCQSGMACRQTGVKRGPCITK